MKIGVLADTHVPDILPALPSSVLKALDGVDIILHAGDVTDLSVLQQLEAIAQTFAVSGDCDDLQVHKYLEEKQRLEFAGRAIGLVHGHAAWKGGMWRQLQVRFNRSLRTDLMRGYVLRQFARVDAIVFGHSHEPYIKMHGSILLFNPGSMVPRQGQRGSIGLLEINPHSIKGRIIPL